MPMTMDDQIFVAHTLRQLAGKQRWYGTADKFGEMEARLSQASIKAAAFASTYALADAIARGSNKCLSV